MSVLVIGLVLFFAAHLVPVAPDTRERLMKSLGEGRYRGLYSLVAGSGLALIVWGYSISPYVTVWTPPVWARHLALVLMIPAIVLVVAAYAPGGRIKAAVKHPMLAGIKIWAVAHLLANGDLASILLFGSFLAFAAIDRVSVAQRERAGLLRTPVPGPGRNDLVAIGIGLAFYAVIVFWLHRLVIGVPVLP